MHCVGAMVGDDDIEELGARMCGVVDLMLSRLKADLNADLLRIALCAFDMHMVRASRRRAPRRAAGVYP